LFGKYFKGGVFGSPFKIWGVAAVLFAVTYSIDVIADLLEFSTTENELLYYILNLLFVVMLSYGIYKFFKDWTKLGTP